MTKTTNETRTRSNAPLNFPENLRYTFTTIPHEIDSHPELDPTGKYLFGFLFSRLCLSAKNRNKFTDRESDRLFLIATIEQVGKKLGCCNTTAIKYLNQLEELGLIDRKIRGQGKPAFIFLNDFTQLENGSNSGETQTLKNSTSRNGEFQCQEIEKVHTSYIDSSYTDSSDNDCLQVDSISSHPIPSPLLTLPPSEDEMGWDTSAATPLVMEPEPEPVEIPPPPPPRPQPTPVVPAPVEAPPRPRPAAVAPDLRATIKANIGFDDILQEQPHREELLEVVLDTIVKTFTNRYRSDVIYMGATQENIETVRQAFLKLKAGDIMFFFGCLDKQCKDVKNLEAFIRVSLYRNISTMAAYKAQQAQAAKNRAKPPQSYQQPARRNKFANFKPRERDYKELERLEQEDLRRDD